MREKERRKESERTREKERERERKKENFSPCQSSGFSRPAKT